MGLITLASPFQPVTTGNQTQNKNLQWAGNALVPWKYSGAAFDFGADAGDTGDAVVPILGTVPADAIGIEMWVNGNASDDYIFSATVAGHLGATGVFATNITANLLAVRWAASGGHIIEPFVTMGVAPTLRVATGKAAAHIQGRFISATSGFPYRLATSNNAKLTGANSVQQIPYNNAAYFPVGYAGAIIQVLGAGPARFTIDGGAGTTATNGDILPIGTYLIDQALHGVSLAALKIYLPTGTNIVYRALFNA